VGNTARTALLALFIVGLTAAGAIRVQALHEERTKARSNLNHIKAILQEDESDIILYGAATKRFLQALAPDLLKRGIAMGYTKQNRKGNMNEPSEELISQIDNPENPAQSILFIYWGSHLPRDNHPQYAKLFPDSSWKLNELVQQLDMVTVISLARLVREPIDPTLPTRIGKSVSKILDDGMLYFKGWVVSPKPIDEVLISIDGEKLRPVKYPTRRRDVLKNIPEYRTEYCGFELRTPYLQRYEGKNISVEAFSADELVMSKIYGKPSR
jgi:hypothetical protein